jgi:hypothetical protein
MEDEIEEHELRVTRSEVAEYLHDMSGQLAEMARRAGLTVAAEALVKAQRAVEAEF